MHLRNEAPEVFSALAEIERLRQSVEELGDVIEGIEDPKSEARKTLGLWRTAADYCQNLVKSHRISADAKNRFIQSVEAHFNNPSFVAAKFSVAMDLLLLTSRRNEDWFGIRYFGRGNVLDTSVYVSVVHPELLNLAKERWGNDSRFNFSEKTPAPDHVKKKLDLLEEHGFPSDLSTWHWVTEALSTSYDALKHLNIDFRLCDYVKWTCTGEPPNMYYGEKFGDPELFEKAAFGDRLDNGCAFTRLDGCVIWRTSDGQYISPLWTYLSWRGDDGFGELGEYASKLGYIGRGLDYAAIAHDEKYDPTDTERLRLTQSTIFRAGEALTSLRVKLCLEESVVRDRVAQVTVQKRAKKGGEKSAAARNKRREQLLVALECLAARNPDITSLAEGCVIFLAVNDAAKRDPKLWSQGQAQAEEYIGEIRRGEAGQQMRDRYLRLFPS